MVKSKKKNKKSEDNIELMIAKTGKEMGMEYDQLKRFGDSRYYPLPWQLIFHNLARKCDVKNGPTKLGAGGARGPGKSHAVFAQVTLDDCQRIPNLKALFLRQTGAAARESFEDLIYRVLIGRMNFEFNKSTNVLIFGNESRVVLGGFKDTKDIDKYIGIEYDLMAVEELNQLTEDKVDKLLGSLRTSKTEWRPRLYASFNPGGVGHTYVKDLFVTPYRERRKSEALFVPATYKDNTHLNSEYIDYLEGLRGDLGKAWREGDFDLFEGQFFSEWRYDKHVVPAFKPPKTWRKFLGIDHGSTKPFSAHWVALDWDNNIWVYREYYSHRPDKGELGKNAEENAKAVVKLMEDDEQVEFACADASIFAKTGHGETIADILQRNGVGQPGTKIPMLLPSMKGTKTREARAQLLHQKLFWNEHVKPKLKVMETNRNLIRTLPALQFSERNPEDVDTDGEDHAYDDLTYILQKIEEVKTQKPPELLTNVERKMEAIKQTRSMTPAQMFNKRFEV